MVEKHSHSILLSTIIVAAITLLFTAGCENRDPNNEKTGARALKTPREYHVEKDTRFENYTESGDLKAIKKRGTIRFITLAANEGDLLPRAAIVTQLHYELATDLAKRLKLTPRWLAAASPEQALQMIQSGRADVFTGNLTRTKQREQKFALSETITRSRQQLVSGVNGPDISNPSKLGDVIISVMEGSTYAATAEELQRKNPTARMEMRALQPDDTVDNILDSLNQSNNLVTVIDSNIVEGVKSYRDDFKTGAFVSEEEDIVWAMRKDSPELKLRINNFLTRKMVTVPKERKADWATIKKSRVIRFLTYNGPTSYFMWKGVLMGFDYDLAKKFADKHDLELELVVVPHDEALIDWLKAGRGDFAGASTTITDQRKSQGVDFSIPYIAMPEQILSSSSKPPIHSLQDLNGRTLTLRAFTIFEDIAKSLQKSGIQVKIEIAAPEVSYERIVNMVAEGEADATIVDASAAEVSASLRDELLAGPLVSGPLPQGWMVIKGNESLLKKMNAFLTRYKKSSEYAKKVGFYFKPNKQGTEKILARLRPGEALSPYDKLVKQSASEHEFDWRLIVAQMWQESSFNPKAESPVGAQGLLQVMPRTAEEVGYPPPLFEPVRGIKAGVKYLDWIRNRFPGNVNLENRLWFSLAAYNAGIGHLYDAQRTAKALNLDPNVWFDNVEVAMLKLSEPRYFKNARYGFVRGAEPVQYVRNISKLYRAYTALTPGEVALIRLLYHPQTTQPRHSAPIPPFRPSVLSCQYGYLRPSGDAQPRPLQAGMLRQSADGFCRPQSTATPAPPGPAR
ncbi:transporter substrate-binding domain-containing protein [Microbulbifer harenosus]|uniref:Transporter substrate-binding domain-containing protein n=1 Tax=Microbulbifer harenosus TaxID=2576840 RepID=A0ABY2UFM4_9GAMM|nr:transporter substrate-binding domain-containing protein [Microbulbifer harenosus]